MPARILVVDDDPQLRRAMARELEAEFEVLTAGNAVEAATLLAAQPEVAAVVTDLMMPGPRGTDLLGDVRRSRRGCGRVLVSAALGPIEVERTVAEGLAHAAVIKPWAPGDVLRATRLSIVAARFDKA